MTLRLTDLFISVVFVDLSGLVSFVLSHICLDICVTEGLD